MSLSYLETSLDRIDAAARDDRHRDLHQP